MKNFAMNILSWSIVMGLYFIVRFSGAESTPDWASTTSGLLLLWVFSSIFLGFTFTISQNLSQKSIIRRRSYGFIILFKIIVVFIALLIVGIASRILAVFEGYISWSELFPSFVSAFMSVPVMSAFLYLIAASFVLAFIKQMEDMIGSRVLYNLLIGKYHFPREESRIFMFLDMKSSTKHAERLGHEKFCRLIQNCFSDLTDSVLKHSVEIYKYVGDEAVLTWELDEGFKDNNCIMVFFDFKKSLEERSSFYEEKYGFVPDFKAGVNMGVVTVAEIGDIKREINYLSDVLNTAARIEGMCNEFDESLIVSALIKDELTYDPNLTFVKHGFVKLRGKSRSLDIYGVK